jgi:Holliday junction resolvase-like predicted endonuclease
VVDAQRRPAKADIKQNNFADKKMHQTKVIKAFGKADRFSAEKLTRSLKRSGVSDEIITEVVQEITAQLQDGITTKQIYKQAFDLLKQYSKPHAARYKLKQAINDLGPSGFPFESFVAELLKYEGYTTQTGVIVEGHCVTHEIDVIAEKDDHHFMVECKFHNNPGIHSDVKVPLYIQSRFVDVAAKWKELPGQESRFHQAWLVTNTRFTGDALTYGTCMGIHLISWDYPEKFSLRDRITTSGLYPLTCLLSLTNQEKTLLLNRGTVLCKQLCRQPELLKLIGIRNEQRIQAILGEAEQVCMQFGHTAPH